MSRDATPRDPTAPLAAGRVSSAARSPRISTAPKRPDPPVVGDVWLRDGAVWGFTVKGWRRYG
jgi:hypothetical protein